MTITTVIIVYALNAVVTMVVARLFGRRGDEAFLIGFCWPVMCLWFIPDLVGTALDHIKPIRDWRKK